MKRMIVRGYVGTIAVGFVRFPFEEIPAINQLVILAVRLRVMKRSSL